MSENTRVVEWVLVSAVFLSLLVPFSVIGAMHENLHGADQSLGQCTLAFLGPEMAAPKESFVSTGLHVRAEEPRAEGHDELPAYPEASFICGCEASVSSCPECQFCCVDIAQCQVRWCRRIPIWWTCSEWVERNLTICLVNCATDWNCR